VFGRRGTKRNADNARCCDPAVQVALPESPLLWRAPRRLRPDGLRQFAAGMADVMLEARLKPGEADAQPVLATRVQRFRPPAGVGCDSHAIGATSTRRRPHWRPDGADRGLAAATPAGKPIAFIGVLPQARREGWQDRWQCGRKESRRTPLVIEPTRLRHRAFPDVRSHQAAEYDSGCGSARVDRSYSRQALVKARP
jgi:hypothetical protein